MGTWSLNLASWFTIVHCEHVACTTCITSPNQLYFTSKMSFSFKLGSCMYVVAILNTVSENKSRWSYVALLTTVAPVAFRALTAICADQTATGYCATRSQEQLLLAASPSQSTRCPFSLFFFLSKTFFCVCVWGAHLLVLLRPKNITISKHCFLNAVCYV